LIDTALRANLASFRKDD